jgi:hypothetical protein
MSMRATARRKVRERIGSDDARVWARELRLRNPYAKSVLMAIANYMNEDGTAFPGLATIARDTDISEDVVSKRLRWLEEIGAIALFKCWRDDAGRRNYEGRGKPTSSEIRFLFDADIEEIEARAASSAGDRPLRGAARRSHHDRGSDDHAADEAQEPLSDSGDSTFSTRHGRGNGEDSQHPSSTLVAPEQHPPAAGTKPPPGAVRIDSSEREEELQPQTPSQSEGAFGREALPDRLEEFAEAYPIPISHFDKARTVWLGLTEAERKDAITGAKGYASLCRSQPKRAVEDAHRWLRNRNWQGYIAAGVKAEQAAQWVTITEGSEEWAAWEIYYRCCGRRSGIPDFQIGGHAPERSARVLGQWPPVGRSIPPDAEWRTHLEGSGQFAAALRKLREMPNAPITFGQKIEGSRYVKTLTVPFDWPPRKDGTFSPSEDDPPGENAA